MLASRARQIANGQHGTGHVLVAGIGRHGRLARSIGYTAGVARDLVTAEFICAHRDGCLFDLGILALQVEGALLRGRGYLVSGGDQLRSRSV